MATAFDYDNTRGRPPGVVMRVGPTERFTELLDGLPNGAHVFDVALGLAKAQ